MDHVVSEHTILADIDHPSLVSLKGFDQDERYLYLLLEYVQGGELFSYLRSQGFLSEDDTRFYAGQVTLMFEYLHSKNIIYRDLKPENLLVGLDGYLKLTDFGFAKYCYGRTYTLWGTPEYIAPEILMNSGHGKPVDWWTLGILIYEMHAGIDPFNDDDPMVIYKKVLKWKYKFPSDFDKRCKSLVKKLLVLDPTERYGYMKNGQLDIKTHKWFSGDWDWDDLINKKISPSFIPGASNEADTSNFAEYPESPNQPEEVPEDEDPFLIW